MLIGIGAVRTTAELVDFQRIASGKGMTIHPHGHPDPTTMITLGVYNPEEHWTNAQRDYISGGSRPSTLGRDLQGVSNQIPQWAWLLAGGTLLALGYLSFRKKK